MDDLVLLDFFPERTRIQPDRLIRILLSDLSCKSCYLSDIGRMQRIASREGDPADIILVQLCKYLSSLAVRKRQTSIRIPGNGCLLYTSDAADEEDV